MIPDCPNFFVRDLVAGTTRIVTTTAAGGEKNAESTRAAMSNDGRAVIFDTAANNIVPGDTVLCDTDNDAMNDDPCIDVFLRILDPAAAGSAT
jgi:hypothetical protein